MAAALPQDPAAVAATAMLGRGTIGDNPNARAAQDVDRRLQLVHAHILTFCATSPSEQYVALANTSRYWYIQWHFEAKRAALPLVKIARELSTSCQAEARVSLGDAINIFAYRKQQNATSGSGSD